MVTEVYLKLAALEADAIPTKSAMRTSISAMVVALVTIAAETVAMNASVLSIKIMANSPGEKIKGRAKLFKLVCDDISQYGPDSVKETYSFSPLPAIN